MQQCSLLCRSQGQPMEIYRQADSTKTRFFRFRVNQNIRTKKIISAFLQVDSPLLSAVQTGLRCTMYLLPTQLQEAPPSLHHQQDNMSRSEISHIRPVAPHDIKIPLSVCTSNVPDFKQPTGKADSVSPRKIKCTHLTSSG